MSDTTQDILDEIEAKLTDGVSPILDFPAHKDLLDRIAIAYVNKESDVVLLGLKQYDPTRSYITGEGVIKDKDIWEALENITPTPFDDTKWDNLTSETSLSDFNIPEWDPGFNSGNGYSTDAQVVRGDRLWASNVDSNTEDPLINAGNEWREISGNNGKFGNTWVEGLYFENQVVSNPTDDRLYKLIADTSVDPFSSVDIDAEIIAGDWILFHDLTGGALTWAQTLALDAATNGNNPLVNELDSIEFEFLAVNLDNGKLQIGNVDPETLRVTGGFRVIALDNDNGDPGNRAYAFDNAGTGTRFEFNNSGLATLLSTGILELKSEGGDDINLIPSAGGGIVKSFSEHQFENPGTVSLIIKAFAVADRFINISTGTLDSISASYTILLPDKGAGTFTMAFLDDITAALPIFGTEYHYDENLPGQSNSTAVELTVFSKVINVTAANHELSASFSVTADNISRTIVVRVFVDAVQVGEDFRSVLSDIDELVTFSTFKNIVLTAGAKTVTLTLATEGAGAVQNSTISNIKFKSFKTPIPL